MAKEGESVDDDSDYDTGFGLIHKSVKSNTTISKEEEEEETEEDRLSALPDSLIVHILSFLDDIKDVIKTCLLSKRWQFIWTDTSEIDLCENSFDFYRNRIFVDWVGRMLSMCGNVIQLNKFSVDFWYDECFYSDVNLWVNIAVNRKVKDVSLICHTLKKNLYEMPQMLYSHTSLASLTICSCAMAPRVAVEWVSLKSLSINQVKLSSCVMENILAGCPILEVLNLTTCRGLKRLKICSPNLTTLLIEDWEVYDRQKYTLDIIAPYVRDLTISGYVETTQFRLRDISSVVRASLHFYEEITKNWTNRLPITMSYMRQLLESLKHVKELELGPQCIEILSMLELKGWNIPTSTRCCLILNALRHKGSVPGILCILKSSPYLETLIIKGRCVFYGEKHDTEELAATYLNIKSNLDLIFHMKTITINSFTESVHDGEPMLTLAQILLNSARVLENMVIYAEDLFDYLPPYISPGLAEISKTVITFPRASPEAVIVVC